MVTTDNLNGEQQKLLFTPGFLKGGRIPLRMKISKEQKVKTFGNELILDILEWQIKSKKKGLRRIYQ